MPLAGNSDDIQREASRGPVVSRGIPWHPVPWHPVASRGILRASMGVTVELHGLPRVPTRREPMGSRRDSHGNLREAMVDPMGSHQKIQ